MKEWLQNIQFWYWDCFFYRKIQSPIETTIYRLKKCYRWSKDVLWNWHYEFDSESSFRLMHYNLVRLLHSLEHGHAIHEDKDIKALKLAIRIMAELAEDRYESKAHLRFEKKWGELKTWTEKKGPHHYFRSAYAKENKRNHKKLREEILEMYKRADAKKQERMIRFGAIWIKYYRRWWD